MLERYLTAASTYAHSIDHLFMLIAVLVGFWLIVAEVMMFWLIFKFRAKDGRPTQYITGEEKASDAGLRFLTSWSSSATSSFSFRRIMRLVQHQAGHAAGRPDRARVIGQQWAWSFQQPGPDGVLDTADDIRTVGELHVTVNTTYHFELMSRDVVHSFAVPAFRLKQDALPGPHDHRLVSPESRRHLRHSMHANVRHRPRPDGGPNYRGNAAGPRRLADTQFESGCGRTAGCSSRCRHDGSATMAEVRR